MHATLPFDLPSCPPATSTNASYIFPRIGLMVVLLWLLWFANSVIQNTVAYLRKQVRSRPASSMSWHVPNA